MAFSYSIKQVSTMNKVKKIKYAEKIDVTIFISKDLKNIEMQIEGNGIIKFDELNDAITSTLELNKDYFTLDPATSTQLN